MEKKYKTILTLKRKIISKLSRKVKILQCRIDELEGKLPPSQRDKVLLIKQRGIEEAENWNRKLKKYVKLHEALIYLVYLSEFSYKYKKGSLRWTTLNGSQVLISSWEDSTVDYETLEEDDKVHVLASHPLYNSYNRELAETLIMNDLAFVLKAHDELKRVVEIW